jgi:lantibiotic modifying enzyme
LADRFDPNSGWRQPDGNFYLGFAHGLAGIVFALDQYRRAIGDQQYLPVIQQALTLESEQFADHGRLAGHGSDFASQPRNREMWECYVGQVGGRIGLTHRQSFDTHSLENRQGRTGASPYQRSSQLFLTGYDLVVFACR